MRLLTYINEDRDINIKYDTKLGEKVKFKELSDLIKNNCKKNFLDMKHSGKWIYRGDRKWKGKKASFLLKAEDRGERRSANTTQGLNRYTELFSGILKSWQGWPTRNKGVICTTSAEKAFDYSDNPFYIIPFDGTKIGICSEHDIWVSFPKLKGIASTLNTFNYGMQHFIPKFNTDVEYELNKKTSYRNNMNELMKVKISDLQWEEYMSSDYEEALFRFSTLCSKYKTKTLGDLFSDLLSPKANGFTLVTSCSSLPSGREVWFDGSGIAISGDIDINNLDI